MSPLKEPRRLDQMYRDAAGYCLDAGLPIDDTPNGVIHQWVIANVRHRPETAFFIVVGICCAMADILAQREGYESASDRAAKMVFTQQCRKGIS